MSADAEKSIRVITFSIKKVDLPIWMEKFLARIWCKDLKAVLAGTVDIPKTNTENPTAAQEALIEKNELAYEEPILSIDGTQTNKDEQPLG